MNMALNGINNSDDTIKIYVIGLLKLLNIIFIQINVDKLWIYLHIMKSIFAAFIIVKIVVFKYKIYFICILSFLIFKTLNYLISYFLSFKNEYSSTFFYLRIKSQKNRFYILILNLYNRLIKVLHRIY